MSLLIKPGMRVMVRDKKLLGTVRYVGLVDFAKGKWIGIELDEAKGKNNGTVQGKPYFECEMHHGMFVRQTQVEPVKAPSGAKSPAPSPSKSSSPSSTKAASSTSSGTGSRAATPSSSRQTSRTKLAKPTRSTKDSSSSSKSTTDEAKKQQQPPQPPQQQQQRPQPQKSRIAAPSSTSSEPGKSAAPRPTSTSSSSASAAANHSHAHARTAGDAPAETEAPAPAKQAHAPATGQAATHAPAKATAAAARSNSKPHTTSAAAAAATKRSTVVEAETDPIRVRELEKYKKQVEQLQQFKELWQQKQDMLVSELNERKRISDVDVQRLESEVAMLKETTQIALLDKQVAEEKNRDLQEEVEELQDKVEELTLTVEILEAEKEEAKAGATAAAPADAKQGNADGGAGANEANGDGGDDDGDDDALNPNRTNNTAAMKALKNKIARLTVALYKLREQNQTLQEENAAVRAELTDAMADNTALGKALQMKDVALEKAMQEYKSQVSRADSHFSAETMVESLTDQNLALEERCQLLEEEVYELRQEVGVLEETQTALEETLDETQADNDEFRSSVNKLMQVLNAIVDRNQEQAEAIAKYSAALKEKEESLQKTQQQQQHQQHAASAAPVQPKPAPAKHKASESKAHQRVAAIEAELHALEEEQAKQHITYLKMFLPEDFFTHDYNGLQLLMLLDRVVRKSHILAEHATAEFAVGQDISEVVTEDSDLTIDQFAFGAALVELLTMLRLDCEYMYQAMHKLDAETFKAVGDVFPQLVAHEPALDSLLKRLRGDGLDPSIPLADVEAAAKAFRTTMTTRIADAVPRDSRDAANVEVQTASGALDVVEAELLRLDEIFKRSSSTGSMDPAFGPLLAHMREMSSQCRDAKTACRKILRHLPPKMADTTIALDEERQQMLAQHAHNLFSAAIALSHASKAYHDHVHGSVTLRALDLDTAMQIGVNARVDLSKDGTFTARARQEGADESMVPVHVPNVLYDAMQLLVDLAGCLEAGDFDVQAAASPETKQPAAWEVNAAAMRKSAAETLALPREVERLSAELAALKKDVKMKDKNLKEKDILLVASKRNIESVRYQCEQQVQEKEAKMAEERAEFDKLRHDMDVQLREFEETYEELSKERDELRKRLYAAEGPSLGGRVSTVGSDVSSAELRAAQVRLFVLQEELAHQRRLTATAQAKSALDTLSALPNICPRRPVPPRLAQAGTAIKAANQVCGDVMQSLASLRVVRLTPAEEKKQKQEKAAGADTEGATAASRAGAGAEPSNPGASLAVAAGQLESLRLRSTRARDELLPLLSAATTQQPTLGAFAGVDHLKRMKEAAEGKTLGTLTLPSSAQIAAARNGRVFLTPETFHSLHAALA
ncbi:hypothetical protein PTSG_09346 [Salpingoeca rosetta]|uniref:CAP-Gly domain-containing protein n=1 Tax=Salpingoeca rosetta (strain ATCC 50818 / BSB-021) TaxID=946362 RepID=F2UMD3_SALR5|nr:uncharacterized protein PTSG_09346 [Salpingoeca rosetta]EGD78282.1 hypothetical protein PTSG_09346 [Salpingoeca rosetta]|eukprot:XP_004989605.1 hypothetical protein PTSG_09346 [Salpingoeca rosetta]